MPYITTTQQLNLYVQTEADLDFFRIKPYITKAEREIKRMIGVELFEELESEQTDDLKKEARSYICGYISNKGISNALNTLNVKVGNIGVKRLNPSKTEKAEWYEIKDLNRDLLTSALMDLNDLLVVLDENPSEFPGIESSPYFLKFKDVLHVKTLHDFEEYFSLNGSYTTFHALKSFMRDVQLKYIERNISGCKVSDYNDSILSNLKGAIVNYTIAEVATSGLFRLEENGGLMKIELMPWEKLENISDNRLGELQKSRMEQASIYMNNVLKEIKELPCYTPAPAVENDLGFYDSGLSLL